MASFKSEDLTAAVAEAQNLSALAASGLAYAENYQAGWDAALKANVTAQNAWKQLRDKAAGYLATLTQQQIEGTLDSFLAGIISTCSVELDKLKPAYAYLEQKIAYKPLMTSLQAPIFMPHAPSGVSQRTPTHAPCLPGSTYDSASGWCVPIAGWPAAPEVPTALSPTDPAPGVLGKLGVTPTSIGVTPETAAGLSFALPPAAGAAIGYFAMRSVLGLALGAGGGLLVSLFLQRGAQS